MSNAELAKLLDPSTELLFEGPHTNDMTSELKLTNPTEQCLCFKVKTTAPKRYCVKPNKGVIDPGKTVKVSVTFHPLLTINRCMVRDKFMVQTFFVREGVTGDPEKLWGEVSSEQIMEFKIKCVFEHSDFKECYQGVCDHELATNSLLEENKELRYRLDKIKQHQKTTMDRLKEETQAKIFDLENQLCEAKNDNIGR